MNFIKGLGSLGLWNFIFFQWFFTRLAFKYDLNTNAYLGWKILFPVVPLTRWIFN